MLEHSCLLNVMEYEENEKCERELIEEIKSYQRETWVRMEEKESVMIFQDLAAWIRWRGDF